MAAEYNMSRRYLHSVLVVFALLLAACQQEQVNVQPLASATVEPRESAMIFTAEQAEQMQVKLWIEGSVPIEGFWTPDAAQLQPLEAALPAFLAENEALFRRVPPPWESLEMYKVQYLGIVEGGEQVIYGNFFCDSAGGRDNWREEMVLVDDGGDCFFQVRYNPTTGEFISLSVNGEA